MNFCLAGIGIHFPKHRKRAIAIGETLAFQMAIGVDALSRSARRINSFAHSVVELEFISNVRKLVSTPERRLACPISALGSNEQP
jgi:hypothetical protein